MFSPGIDVVDIKRIEKLLENKSFLNRFFGEKEIAELEQRGIPAQSVAGAFAAKEAFSKAIGTGISGFSLNEVQLLHETNGKPFLYLCGNAKRLAGKMEFSVSITHTDTIAQAIVIGYC